MTVPAVSDAPDVQESYDPQFFARIAAVEDRHFWFQRRLACIGAAVRSLPDASSLRHILEVGCGTGMVLKKLQELFPQARVVGMDLHFEGLAYARQRFPGLLVQGSVLQSPLACSIDLIGLFDVLEHLPDDLDVLRHLLGQLKPGGYLVITVPAHAFLWSYFDEASCHCRRYSSRELNCKLREAGFNLIYLSQFMSVLFPLMWLKRRVLKKASGASDAKERDRAQSQTDLQVPAWANWLLSCCLRPEAALVARRCKLPVGTSLLAVAGKPL